MPTFTFVIEQHLDSLWGMGTKDPSERLTDLPPVMVKDHHRGDSKDWQGRNLFAQQQVYIEYAEKLQKAFKKHAKPGETLEIDSNATHSYWNTPDNSEITGTLQKAIEEVGLPTRADVERMAKIIEEL